MPGVELINFREAQKSLQKKRKLSSSLNKIFDRIEVLAQLLREEGLEVNERTSSYALGLFLRTSLGLQRKIIQNISTYVGLLESQKQKGADLRDSRRLTWAFLKEQNLQPCFNTFSKIDAFDTIEIFNREYIQIFRNLRFFETFKCPLFDLLVLDWMTLFKRQPEIEEKVFFQMEDSFKCLPRVTNFENINDHCIRERFAENSKDLTIQLKMRSPLMSRTKKTKRAEVVLITSRIVDNKLEGAPATHLKTA